MSSKRLWNLTIAVPIVAGLTMVLSPALAQSMDQIAAGAAKEGQLVTYGMSDDWVNLGAIFDAIQGKYKVAHTDTDMTSAEEITHLMAEKNAPVMDMADIGYDFLGRLLDNNLAASFKNSFWDSIPADRKDPDGRWASAYWGAISILVNTDVVKTMPATWNDLLKPEYKDMVCSRDPRVSTYATASVLAAAYANGGGEDNVQPGLDWFKKLRDTGNLRQGVVLNVASVQKGECPISLVYDFDGLAKRDSTGLPLKVIIPQDGTVGMIFAQYMSATAPHPNAARAALDFLYSDQGQIMLAEGHAHPTRDVALPDDVKAKIVPASEFKNLHFPSSLKSVLSGHQEHRRRLECRRRQLTKAASVPRSIWQGRMLRGLCEDGAVNHDEIKRRSAFARQIAREAGEIAKRYLHNPELLDVREKGRCDLVTQADLEVDRFIVTSLSEIFPTDGVLTEELGGSMASRLWVIDPIDGTQNFARGIAHFAISIAFHADGRTEIGVVYDPIAEEMFVAVRGRGAFLNDQPLRIRDDGRAKSRLIEVGYSSVQPIEDYLQLVGALVRSGHGIVQGGSAALGLARVASARVDGYCELFLNSWDILAGILLVEEAGGWANDFVGNGGIEHGGAVLACAPQLAGLLRNVTGIA